MERRNGVALADAKLLIDGFVAECGDDVGRHLHHRLAVVLGDASEGRETAITYWKAIERTLRAPLRAPDKGELVFQPHLERTAIVNSLCSHYWFAHLGGHDHGEQ
jgi:hypothetical protein